MGLASGCRRGWFSPLKPHHNSSATFCSNISSKSSSFSSYYFLPTSGKFEFHGPGRMVYFRCSKSMFGAARRSALPESERSDEPADNDDARNGNNQQLRYKNEFGKDGPIPTREMTTVIEEADPEGNTAIISACFVGLLTGIGVVIFNNAVHEIRDLCWDGIPNRGASWLREEPTKVIWKQVVFVPACGGLVVGMLNFLRVALEVPTEGVLSSSVKDALEPILKTVAACVTLGTGNSLGPEGPSVEIGASIAKGVGTLFDRGAHSKLSLKAAGSAAGIASGFNAAVTGCFFAIESVLWPSPVDSSLSQTNTTSMVILSAVIASVVSEIGLGSEPAFTVPGYDFRSPSELPLYLLLGILCGMVSLILSWCTSFMVVTFDNVQKNIGMPKAAFPVFGGLAVGIIALTYPEILYWGFENVDVLLESRPFVKNLSADLLLQLVAVKIVATSLCRASGLVGGYYAPSLFIGAATGMSYGKFVSFVISQSNPIFHLSFLEVASPQAYGLVGMAATLAGVCQVPLTAVLLLFELTQDYRIVLPLLGAVGLSSWITSGYTRRREGGDALKFKEGNKHAMLQPDTSSCNPDVLSSTPLLAAKGSCTISLRECGDSLCVDDTDADMIELAKRILVSQAMRTRYVTVLMSTFLTEAVTLMLAEKQSCAVIVDDKSLLIGLLTLGDIQEFSKLSKEKSKRPEELVVSELCHSNNEKCRVSWTVTPSMSLLSAHFIMSRYGMSQLPVILEHVEDHRGGLPVGLLDRECISFACRADNGFKPGFYLAIEKALAEKLPAAGIKAKPHIESRLKTLKTEWAVVYDMLHGKDSSGFGWDVENHVLEASKDVWIPYLKVHQKRAKWQNKTFPHYLDLCVIFGKDRATGKDALSAAEMVELDEEIQTNDGDDDLIPTRSEEISSKSSSFKKRKRKSSFDIDSESAMERAAIILAAQLEKSSAQFANFLGLEASLNEQRKNLSNALSNVPGLTDSGRNKVICKFAREEELMVVFFSLPDERKEGFVKDLLSGVLY